jgi:hypothetical protein
MAEHKILQIMPANGWGAVFVENEDELIAPLAGWALVSKDDGTSSVMGLVAWEHVELAETQPNFARYVDLSEMFEDDFEEFEEFDDDFDEDDEDFDEEPGGEPPYDPKTGLLN